MANSQRQRLKLLYLMRILLERTDEQHPMSTSEIIAALALYDIKVERKTVYSDIELLQLFGIDIEKQRDITTRYYVAGREFELPELKLLVDAVQSSRFITQKKSEALIKKITSLTSSEQAKQLNRQVFVSNRAKATNEVIYYSIDIIHIAINENKKIAFKYFDYDTKKDRIFRKDSESYNTTPVALCWNDDKYYLIAYSAKYDNFTHYRVDRMSDVGILDEVGDKCGSKAFIVTDYIKKVFGMFNDGVTVRAKLSFHYYLVNAVLDHFGKDVPIIPSDNEWFDISVDVSISPVFLAWMFQFGEFAKIKAPDSLIEAMMELLETNWQKYDNDE